MDNKKELQRRVAWLETRLDQVESELSYLNYILVDCGFPEGIASLKTTIEELLNEASELSDLPPDDRLPPTSTYDPFE